MSSPLRPEGAGVAAEQQLREGMVVAVVAAGELPQVVAAAVVTAAVGVL